MKTFALVAVAIVAAFLLLAALTGQPFALLPAAAVLTFTLGLGHSIIGERKLITPILQLEGLPTPRGSVRQTRQVLRLGWHLTTLLWWAMAVLLLWMHLVPADLSRAFLWMVAIVFGLCGVVPLANGNGRHASWIYFLLVSAFVAGRLWVG